MRFVNPIPFVRDVRAATTFYRDIVGLVVEQDHGNFVLFEGRFAIHDGASLAQGVWGQDTIPDPDPDPFGRRNLLLYFEEPDIEVCFSRLKDHVALIHGLQKQPWGQRVFRFYDLDGHVVEVGEAKE
jgi:catechol 2,3-dioxygenase-like lactoylglutathione lyase family enzyme